MHFPDPLICRVTVRESTYNECYYYYYYCYYVTNLYMNCLLIVRKYLFYSLCRGSVYPQFSSFLTKSLLYYFLLWNFLNRNFLRDLDLIYFSFHYPFSYVVCVSVFPYLLVFNTFFFFGTKSFSQTVNPFPFFHSKNVILVTILCFRISLFSTIFLFRTIGPCVGMED